MVEPNCLVEVELADGKAHIAKLYSTYPIRIIQQKSSSSCIYLVAVGFGGGLVQGDRVDFDLTVGKDCHIWYERTFAFFFLKLPTFTNHS